MIYIRHTQGEINVVSKNNISNSISYEGENEQDILRNPTAYYVNEQNEIVTNGAIVKQQKAARNKEFGQKVLDQAMAEFYNNQNSLSLAISEKFNSIIVDFVAGNIRAAREKIALVEIDGVIMTEETRTKYLTILDNYLQQ